MMQAAYPTLEALSAGIEDMRGVDADWYAKMVHTLPLGPTVERVPWLLGRCTGKTVVHFGAGGLLHGHLAKVTTKLYGVDREAIEGCVQVDLDWELDTLPVFDDVELVLLPEIVEHLVNGGHLLQQLRVHYPTATTILTVPSCWAPQARLKHGIEVVNKDHTVWFSPQTLHIFLGKCGYTVKEWLYYNGKPPYSEGMIAVAQGSHP